ncbi:MAG: heat-inducible transcription repressor HrcA [Oscillospiraceae bacterium]|nr:heat-inducible transcription repressor HrcA [Oscillospiraceae bacterium]MBQ5816480.1 heat-inducible transcription repressor HrcA [Oscillospiraceae bacterium]
MELNERKLAVLSLIAKGYLKTGEPIGSKSLVSLLDGAVSSATIRNDMAELERRGLLYQPHTSAGRIPTAAGMRLYTERLIKKRRLSRERREVIDSLISGAHSVEDAVSAVSSALADASNCVSFSTAPSGRAVTLKQIDFIKTGQSSMIFVAVTETGIIKSVFVNLFGLLTDEALKVLSKACEQRLEGKALCDITPPYLQTMAAELTDCSLLFSPFFEALSQTVNELQGPEVFIKGQANIFGAAPSAREAQRALNLLNSEGFASMLAPKSSTVSIVIPDDEVLSSTALLYTGYRFSDELIGSIGVLGSYRLDYEGIIPMLEYFSVSLENMLKNRLSN